MKMRNVIALFDSLPQSTKKKKLFNNHNMTVEAILVAH